MYNQLPQETVTKYSFNINEVVRSDKTKEIFNELVLFISHLANNKSTDDFEKLDFNIDDFINFSKRTNESLMLDPDIESEIYLDKTNKSIIIKNELECILIRMARASVSTTEVYYRENQQRIRFSAQSLMDFEIEENKNRERKYFIYLKKLFHQIVLKQTDGFKKLV